jgi:hypothetical protein
LVLKEVVVAGCDGFASIQPQPLLGQIVLGPSLFFRLPLMTVSSSTKRPDEASQILDLAKMDARRAVQKQMLILVL